MAIGSGTSGAGARGAVRWCIPSAADLIFIAFLGLLAFTSLSVRLLSDAGIGWHIRCGQLILATHTIPRVDPFSSTMHGQPWFAWEWLFDIIVGWLERVGGLNAVVLFAALIIATVYAWTVRLLLRRGTNLFLALMLTLLACSAAMIHFQARPHVLSWLFTLAWFCILESTEDQPNRRPSSTGLVFRNRFLWFLPLLMLLWVNVHGGFLVGFVLLLIYWLDAAGKYLKPGRDRFEDILRTIQAGRRFRCLSLIGLISAAVTLINPYGFRLHIHIYRYLSNRFLMDHIDEFQSPNFHYAAQKCFAVLLLLTIVAVATKCSDLRLDHILVVIFATSSALYASRNIPVSSLLLVLVIGPWLSEAMENYAEKHATPLTGQSSANFFQRMQAVEFSLRGHVWPLATIVLSCYIAAHGGALGTKLLMDAHFDSVRFPVEAVSFLEEHDVRSPLLAPDYWGGYLIYRLYPKAQVVVDDRHDLYGEQFLKSYLKMIHVEAGWHDFLDQFPPQYILVPKGSALESILLENGDWALIYSDYTASIFAPRGASLQIR